MCDLRFKSILSFSRRVCMSLTSPGPTGLRWSLGDGQGVLKVRRAEARTVGETKNVVETCSAAKCCASHAPHREVAERSSRCLDDKLRMGWPSPRGTRRRRGDPGRCSGQCGVRTWRALCFAAMEPQAERPKGDLNDVSQTPDPGWRCPSADVGSQSNLEARYLYMGVCDPFLTPTSPFHHICQQRDAGVSFHVNKICKSPETGDQLVSY